jgi:hypothetical protein
MSRILRRPMFRGGRVDSRGTGIASGLSYEKGGSVNTPKRGLVDGPGGYAGKDPLSKFIDPYFDRFNKFIGNTYPEDYVPEPFQPRNFADDAMFFLGPGKFFKAGGGGMNLIRQMGKQPLFPSGYKAGFKKGMRSGEPEAAPFLSNKYFKDLISPYTSGMKELTKQAVGHIKDYAIPYGIGSLGAGVGLSFLGDDEDPNKKTEEEKLKELKEKQKEKEALAKLLTDLANAEKDKAKDAIGGEEDIEINKEKYAKLLGGDKARGKDVTDMLLSFAGKALKPEATVKGAFGEFFEDEAKRPSRRDKVDDAAATLAINEYIAGKKSKAELDRFFAQTDYKASLTSRTGKDNIAINIADASAKLGTGYKGIAGGLRISFPKSGTPIKLDVDKGDTVDNVPLIADNYKKIFIEDEAPYRAIIIDIVDGQLIRDPIN